MACDKELKLSVEALFFIYFSYSFHAEPREGEYIARVVGP
jgi:hypothetical protein